MTTTIKMPPTFSYIGSKIKLTQFIGHNVCKYINKPLSQIQSFCDLFSGTSVVAFYFMQQGVKKVISNDIQHYSATISSVWTTKNIDVKKIKQIIADLNKLSTEITDTNIISSNKDFIYNTYSPASAENRMYFTKTNAFRIDKVRQNIEKWKEQLTTEEHNLLLKILLYAVVNISNNCSTYGAYLKDFQKKSRKTLVLKDDMLNLLINDAGIEHTTYNLDINRLLDENDMSEIECCYLDSPYNNRSYSSNYFVLECVSKYHYPEVKGKTGLLVEDLQGSKSFTSKLSASKSFEDILSKIKSKYVFISYSSESIVKKEEMIQILYKTNWINVQCIEQPYKRYKSNKNCEQEKHVVEFLFCATKAG